MNDIKEAIAAFKQGTPVIIIDDEDRENEADICLPAQFVQSTDILFFLKRTTGLLCVSCNPLRADQLKLDPMTSNNTDPHQTPFTVSVDLHPKHGMTSGVSAIEKAKTIRAMADLTYGPDDFTRPGHVFPLKASPKGLYGRQGHTEASIELCKLADVYPACLIAEIMNSDGTMARLCHLQNRKEDFDKIPIISVSQIKTTLQIPTVRLPIQLDCMKTMNTELKINNFGTDTYFTLVKGDVSNKEAVFLRIHSECVTGDLFRSSRCDCGSQLEETLHLIQELPEGLLIYIKGQEGRGIGIEHKLICYHLQDVDNENTVTANQKLYLPVDSRDYSGIANILKDLKVLSVNLYSQDPQKIKSVGPYLKKAIPFRGRVTPENKEYLKVKAEHVHKRTIKIGLVYPIAWHQKYINHLRDQVKTYFNKHNVCLEENLVSGSYELVMGAQALVSQNCSAILALGILLKGETYHFESIATAVTNGLMKLQLKTKIPIINGVLACYSDEQINERVFGDKNQIEQWCQATLEMASKKY